MEQEADGGKNHGWSLYTFQERWKKKPIRKLIMYMFTYTSEYTVAKKCNGNNKRR